MRDIPVFLLDAEAADMQRRSSIWRTLAIVAVSIAAILGLGVATVGAYQHLLDGFCGALQHILTGFC